MVSSRSNRRWMSRQLLCQLVRFIALFALTECARRHRTLLQVNSIPATTMNKISRQQNGKSPTDGDDGRQRSSNRVNGTTTSNGQAETSAPVEPVGNDSHLSTVSTLGTASEDREMVESSQATSQKRYHVSAYTKHWVRKHFVRGGGGEEHNGSSNRRVRGRQRPRNNYQSGGH